MKKLALALGASLVLFGCGGPKIRPMTNDSIKIGKTVDQVKEDIVKGAESSGWTVTGDNPGKLELTLNVRKHMVKVDVPYNEKSYSIEYKDSENLDYNPKNGSIHGKYLKWVAKLKKHIDKNLRK